MSCSKRTFRKKAITESTRDAGVVVKTEPYSRLIKIIGPERQKRRAVIADRPLPPHRKKITVD